MLTLAEVRVDSVPDRRGYYISWRPETGHVYDINRYEFTVLRSQSSAGPWDPVADNIVDKYAFHDTSVSKDYPGFTIVYKIRVTDKESGDTWESKPTYCLDHDLDPVGREIRLREALYLRRLIGRRVVLLQRRTFGTRCGCWDPQLQQKLRSHCLTCYDTSYVGGYLNPVLIDVSFQPSKEMLQHTPQLVVTANQTVAWTSYLPRVKVNDILVEESGTRWRVAEVHPSERLRVTIRQVLVVQEIPHGDIEYDIPIGIDADDKFSFVDKDRLMIRHS